VDIRNPVSDLFMMSSDIREGLCLLKGSAIVFNIMLQILTQYFVIS
jgi:hypothetical protein